MNRRRHDGQPVPILSGGRKKEALRPSHDANINYEQWFGHEKFPQPSRSVNRSFELFPSENSLTPPGHCEGSCFGGSGGYRSPTLEQTTTQGFERPYYYEDEVLRDHGKRFYLVARGGKANDHVTNKRVRREVDKYREEYAKAERSARRNLVVSQLVESMLVDNIFVTPKENAVKDWQQWSKKVERELGEGASVDTCRAVSFSMDSSTHSSDSSAPSPLRRSDKRSEKQLGSLRLQSIRRVHHSLAQIQSYPDKVWIPVGEQAVADIVMKRLRDKNQLGRSSRGGSRPTKTAVQRNQTPRSLSRTSNVTKVTIANDHPTGLSRDHDHFLDFEPFDVLQESMPDLEVLAADIQLLDLEGDVFLSN